MRKKIRPLFLEERDYVFFKYLHAQKVALIEQIHRDVLLYESVKGLYSRLENFEQNGWITGYYHISQKKRKILSLTLKGFRQFVSTGEERRLELGSHSIAHDLDLVDIRSHLKRSKKVSEYYEENTLQTWSECGLGELHSFVDLHSDAAIKVNFPNGAFYMAIEYEAQRKFDFRYDRFFGQYYRTPEVSAVLLICGNDRILKSLMAKEKYSFANEMAKFFYKTIEDLKEDPELKFINRDGKVLSIGESTNRMSVEHSAPPFEATNL